MFARLVGYTNRHTPAPCSRRAYSFFSSKSGGGRYFNSAKPPNSSKAVAPTGKAKAESASSDDAVKPSSSSSSGSGVEEASACAAKEMYNSPQSWFVEPVQHAQITPHDLNLHNFFSLHRPLLLLSQTTSSLFDTPAGVDFATKSQHDVHVGPSVPAGVGNFEDVPEASPEADADAARLLARALVINRLGATVNWEHTLKRLGLDVDEERIEECETLMDSFDAYMDSTKRKRRRKMKKHKLKKRRRLQRAQRIKIGK